MNRNTSLTVKHDPSWMTPEDWADAINKFNIEGALDVLCPQWDEHVIWLESYDAAIIDTMLSHNPPAEIHANFRKWYENGFSEIRITEDNNEQFDYKLFLLLLLFFFRMLPLDKQPLNYICLMLLLFVLLLCYL